MNKKISNRPPKGTQDWWPDEFRVRNYIFDTWRKVNRQFNYEEYLTPLLESADVYRAKSGEDVGGKELMVMVDRAGRELAIRPEMTPSVTRMVTRFYKQATKPLRLFSIANYYRNERPQRGRNREFWQLNSDIFGADSLTADLEILQLALELMLAFRPPAGSFVLHLNHRQLIDAILSEAAQVPDELRMATVRLLDKFGKLGEAKFRDAAAKAGLNDASITALIQFMGCSTGKELLGYFPLLKDNKGFQEAIGLFHNLIVLGYEDWVAFDPSVIRGFDYYDGMVFEIFDRHPDNNRSLFGGGRYNGLASIFGNEQIPGVGFAPGDETMKLFLQSWDIIPAMSGQEGVIYFPLLGSELAESVGKLTRQLRNAGLLVEQGLARQSIGAAMKYAGRKGVAKVLLLGSNEMEQGVITVKDLASGEQMQIAQEALIEALSGD